MTVVKTIDKKDRNYLILLIFLVIIFFYKIIFGKFNYFIGDIYTQFFPWKEFLKRSIQSGALPFWDPFTFSGMPFLADIQKGVFYPLGIIFIFLDFDIAFKIFVITHFILMALFVYLFLRKVNFSAVGAFLGSLIYCFNTFTISKIIFISSLGVITFLPVLLYFLFKIINEKRLYDFILFIFVYSIIWLSGNPTIFYYATLFICLFWIFLKLDEFYNIKNIIQMFFLIFIVIFFLIFITLPQTGLFFDLLKNSTRAEGVFFNDAVIDSLSFDSLLSFLMPAGKNGLFIDPYRDWLNFSLGILNFFSVTFIFLFTISLFLNKDKIIYFCYFIIFISILLSLGKNTPVYSLFYIIIPGFSFLRHPGFAITMILIPVSIIAAFVIDEISAATERQLSLFSSSRGILNAENYLNIKFAKRLLNIFMLLLILFILIILNYKTILKLYNLDFKVFKNFVIGIIYFVIFYGLNILFLIFKENFFISRKFYIFLIILLTISELFYFSSKINPLIDSEIYNIEKIKPETVDLVKTSSFKILHTDYLQKTRITKGKNVFEAQKNFLLSIPSNTSILYNIYDAYGYNPLILDKYQKIYRKIFNEEEILDYEKLKLLNVKYILSFKNLEEQKLNKIYDGFYKIYENKDALPIFFMSKEKENLKPVIMQALWGRKSEGNYNYYKIDIINNEEGYFVFSNNYYKGWKAFLNNKAVKIEKIFDIYMGLKVPKGSNTIIFTFYPEKFDIYFTVFYFTILFIFSLLILYYKKDNKRNYFKNEI